MIHKNIHMPDRFPPWIRPRLGLSETRSTRTLMRNKGVVTVCEEARCPNRSECFKKPSAAFMILGASCTRNCGFCSVSSPVLPLPPDPDEPGRVASAALEMGLHYVVITSVTRDDLNDGGAAHFASTVNALRKADEDMKIEVLTPDFKGDHVSVDTVLSSCPDVYNHNLETVPRLYSQVRQGAEYERSLRLLEHVKRVSPKTRTKSGLMLGLGEATQEVESVLRELRTVGCDFVTIGQYLRPGRNNIPVKEYIHPDVFEELRHSAIRMGFRFVASSPLTRSSMNAEEMFSKDRGVN